MTMTEVTSNALLSSKKLLKEFNTLQKINILKAEKVLSRFAEANIGVNPNNDGESIKLFS